MTASDAKEELIQALRCYRRWHNAMSRRWVRRAARLYRFLAAREAWERE